MINSKVMEQVKTLKYLRNTVLIYGHMDLENKINNFNKTGRSVRRNFSRNMSKDFQLRFNKITAKSVLMLESEM